MIALQVSLVGRQREPQGGEAARQLPSTEAALAEQGVSVMSGHASTVNSLAVSTDGTCLVSGTAIDLGDDINKLGCLDEMIECLLCEGQLRPSRSRAAWPSGIRPPVMYLLTSCNVT